MITPERIYELMTEAIIESKKSIPEDQRVHPKVGAVLSDINGNIIARSHRGESGNGGHCEYNIIKKAALAGVNFEDTALFVTLEPCTTRGSGKTPCAQRIVDSKIPKVYIGMLDPYKDICGRGETFLRIHTSVERFPGELVKQIEDINEEFVEKFRSDLLPDSSLYVSKQISDLIIEYLQSTDLQIKELPTDWELTIDDIIAHCNAKNIKQDAEYISTLVIDARNKAYDRKYCNYTYDKDVRGIAEKWKHEFKEILCQLNIQETNNYDVINVGCGNGIEAQALFSDVKNLTLVDIGPDSLICAKEKLPDATIIQNCAENMKDIKPESQDIYVSLRTYQSSYFDLVKSIREAYRILRPNAAIILSVANGFVDDNKVVIPGLVIPKTKIVDRNRPYEVVEQIRRKLSLLNFKNVCVRTGIGEIYIYGRRS